MQPNINISIDGRRASKENPVPVVSVGGVTSAQLEALQPKIDALSKAILDGIDQIKGSIINAKSGLGTNVQEDGTVDLVPTQSTRPLIIGKEPVPASASLVFPKMGALIKTGNIGRLSALRFSVSHPGVQGDMPILAMFFLVNDSTLKIVGGAEGVMSNAVYTTMGLHEVDISSPALDSSLITPQEGCSIYLFFGCIFQGDPEDPVWLDYGIGWRTKEASDGEVFILNAEVSNLEKVTESIFPDVYIEAAAGGVALTPALPRGGAAGQVLKKTSDDDFKVEWSDAADGNTGGGTGGGSRLTISASGEYSLTPDITEVEFKNGQYSIPTVVKLFDPSDLPSGKAYQVTFANNHGDDSFDISGNGQMIYGFINKLRPATIDGESIMISEIAGGGGSGVTVGPLSSITLMPTYRGWLVVSSHISSIFIP